MNKLKWGKTFKIYYLLYNDPLGITFHTLFRRSFLLLQQVSWHQLKPHTLFWHPVCFMCLSKTGGNRVGQVRMAFPVILPFGHLLFSVLLLIALFFYRTLICNMLINVWNKIKGSYSGFRWPFKITYNKGTEIAVNSLTCNMCLAERFF